MEEFSLIWYNRSIFYTGNTQVLKTIYTDIYPINTPFFIPFLHHFYTILTPFLLHFYPKGVNTVYKWYINGIYKSYINGINKNGI